MYELVNTSVPNGLVAGSHGFATVAMTQGMPDAIRLRLEGLCAYPHRSSSHDESYETQNPVNWFHLVLPTGDHVVGRTSPAAFDYTGRTNRLAHILHFSPAEMPAAGGAAVLLSEESRLATPWNGTPRFLPMDALGAERLQRLSAGQDARPMHWTQLFGGISGADLAKRFARLLSQNLRGVNKCIYFKAGASDIDGRRLLGLFGDLIALLPEDLASRATFATFAACVPNGMTCHLRGVFDADRAFEAASATQPWVDCGTGAVHNAHLLPRDFALNKELVRETSARRIRQEVSPVCPAAQTSRSDVRESAMAKWIAVLGVSLAAVVFAVALLVFRPWETPELQNPGMNSARPAEVNESAADNGTNDLGRKTAGDLGAELEQKSEEVGSVKPVAVSEPVKSVRHEKKPGQRTPLREMQIDEVLFSPKADWTLLLTKKEKLGLLASDSVEIVYPRGEDLSRTRSRFAETGADLRTGEKYMPKLADDLQTKIGDAPWCVIHLPSLDKTYWLWRHPIKKAIFANAETADLSKVVFGDAGDALALYRRHVPNFAYVVSWGRGEIRTAKNELSIQEAQERYSIRAFPAI